MLPNHHQLALFLLLAVFMQLGVGVTLAPAATGTTLPTLTASSAYRIFNDLKKQSSAFVPYQQNTNTYIPGRKWGGYNLNLSLTDQYPLNLQTNIFAESDISLFSGIDDALVGTTFEVTFDGNGSVGVYQNGSFNVTVNSSQKGTFVLGSLNTVAVFIYRTDPANRVTNLKIVPSGISDTFTSNFLSYVSGLEVIRYAYWQGNPSGVSNTIRDWTARTSPQSATQLRSEGVALQYIFELQSLTGSIPWISVPDNVTSSDYYTQMGALAVSLRLDPTKQMLIEFGNAYSLMNDIPDKQTNPTFDVFLQGYGSSYRSNIVFTICYWQIQYFLNAQGMRTTPVNYTLIDAIATEGSFGALTVQNAYNKTTQELKALLVSQQLQKEVILTKAYQYAQRHNLSLLAYKAGPVIKVPQYGWKFTYDFLNNHTDPNLLFKTQQIELSGILKNFTTLPWVGELLIDWTRRLKNIGFTTICVGRLVQPFTDDRPDTPLLEFLNTSTARFTALKQFVTSSRVSTLPLSKPLPADSFICNPNCVWGDCINNTCFCYQDYSGPDCSVYSAPTPSQTILGANAGGLADYGTTQPYIDLMKTARGWACNLVGGGLGSGAANMSSIQFSPEGYPLSLPLGLTLTTIMVRDLQTHYDQGTYVVLYEGDGTFEFGLFDVIAVRRGVGRIQVDVIPSTNFNNGILMTITRTNPSNPLKNIRVIRPGFEYVQTRLIFHPMYLTKLAPYSTIRFMDWLSTNTQTDEQFTDRVTQSNRTYTINGAPLEDMVHLCNMLGKDMWLNVPHLASDDYIEKMAQLVHDGLRPELKVYVQYSNQVWGALFAGGIYAQQQGIAQSLDTDPDQARFCFLGVMTQIISNKFRAVFADRPSKLQIVVSTQSVNADTTKRILQCQDTYMYVDAVAIAPYLSANISSTPPIDTLMDTLLPQELQKINVTLKTHLIYTNNYNLSLYCYESGQGLVGTNAAQTALQIKAQSDSRMQAIYTKYLQILYENNIRLANFYTDVGPQSQYGSWGQFVYYDQRFNQSTKWNGTIDYFNQRSITLPSLTLAKCNRNCSGNGVCHYNTCFCYSDYSGYNCQIPKFIDYKQCGYLCSGHGTCEIKSTDGNKRYFGCTCDTGFMGAYCSIGICPSNCNYQGLCVGNNVCQCFEGRTGTTCEIDCGCDGHGVCSTTNNTCACDEGYYFNTTVNKCKPVCPTGSVCSGPYLKVCTPECVYGDCRNGSCACWPGYSGSSCDISSDIKYVNDYLGINIGGLAYYSTQFIFIDYFLQSSAWIPQYYPQYYNSTLDYTWNTNENIPKQANGYPSSLNASQKVAKLLLRDLQLHYPQASRKYLALYEGEGIISLGFDAKIEKYRPGRIEFNVTPSTVRDNGVYLSILKTNPANPIKNIRVVLKQDEYNLSQQLNQHFLDFLAQFSTIRYMDLLHTNGNPIVQWNETTALDADTQASDRGFSVSFVVNITNRSGRNAWINIPHLASDDFVSKLATYLFTNLAPRRIVYVEYSNEVWNTFFAQGQYAQDQAAALNLSNHHKFYAKRSLEIFNIFESVFGNMTSSRLRFVISSQAVSTWVAQQILSYPGVSQKANILAIAPYFDCDSIGNSSNSKFYSMGTVDNIIERCQKTISTLDSWLTSYQQIANKYNLSFACYEAGTSISQQSTIYGAEETQGLTDKFIAANRDARMKSIYTAILSKMKSFGLLQSAPSMLFSSIGLPSKYGSWGLLDYSQQIYEKPTHPKYQAVIDFNSGAYCTAYIYKGECIKSCPSSTYPKVVDNILQCLDCGSNCESNVVRFTITLRITLRVLSVQLKPSQPLNPNANLQFKIVLMPKSSSKRLLAAVDPLQIPIQSTASSASGISAQAVIPDNVDTSLYGSMSVQFNSLTSSPSPSGALIGDSALSFDLSQAMSSQQKSLSVIGKIVSIISIVIVCAYMIILDRSPVSSQKVSSVSSLQSVTEQPRDLRHSLKIVKAVNFLLLLQSIYLLCFNINSENWDTYDILSGLSYSVLGFLPSFIPAPSKYIQASNQAISRFAIDGNFLRNAGQSLSVLICYIALLLIILPLFYFVSKKQDSSSKLFQKAHEIAKIASTIIFWLVFSNLLAFAFFELRFWSLNSSNASFLPSYVASMLVIAFLTAPVIYTLLKQRNYCMFVLQIKTIAICLIIALVDIPVTTIIAIPEFFGIACLLPFSRRFFEASLLQACLWGLQSTVLPVASLLVCIYAKQSPSILGGLLSVFAGLYALSLIVELVMEARKNTEQILPETLDKQGVMNGQQASHYVKSQRNILIKKTSEDAMRNSELLEIKASDEPVKMLTLDQ